jgi:hypothetical protein
MIDSPAPRCTPTIEPPITAAPEKTNRTIKFLVAGLEQGIKPIYQQNVQNAAKFTHFIFSILNQLITKKNSTFVDVAACQYEFTVSENIDGVFLTYLDVTNTTKYKLFKELQFFLFNDILNYPEIYPAKLIKLSLNYLMGDGINDDLPTTMKAVRYILNCSQNVVTFELNLAAANHVFQHDQDYLPKEITQLATAIIRQAIGTQPMQMDEAARYILDKEENCSSNLRSIAKRSACTFIIYYADDFSLATFNRAATHIGLHPNDYPKQVVIKAALGVIIQNPSFFLTAILDNNEFTAFYERIYAPEIMNNYSDQLYSVLCADQTAHPIFIEGFALPTQFKTNYECWKSRQFNDAFKADERIAIFILNNITHPAMMRWNEHHEITDEKGKRKIIDYQQPLPLSLI